MFVYEGYIIACKGKDSLFDFSTKYRKDNSGFFRKSVKEVKTYKGYNERNERVDMERNRIIIYEKKEDMDIIFKERTINIPSRGSPYSTFGSFFLCKVRIESPAEIKTQPWKYSIHYLFRGIETHYLSAYLPPKDSLLTIIETRLALDLFPKKNASGFNGKSEVITFGKDEWCIHINKKDDQEALFDAYKNIRYKSYYDEDYNKRHSKFCVNKYIMSCRSIEEYEKKLNAKIERIKNGKKEEKKEDELGRYMEQIGSSLSVNFSF